MSVITAAIYTRISFDPDGRQAGVGTPGARLPGGWQRTWLGGPGAGVPGNDTSASTSSKKRRPVYEQLMRDVSGSSRQRRFFTATAR